MRICEIVNGQTVYRDATAAEEQELLNKQENAPAPVLSEEERIAVLEAQLEAAKILLGVE